MLVQANMELRLISSQLKYKSLKRRSQIQKNSREWEILILGYSSFVHKPAFLFFFRGGWWILGGTQPGLHAHDSGFSCGDCTSDVKVQQCKEEPRFLSLFSNVVVTERHKVTFFQQRLCPQLESPWFSMYCRSCLTPVIRLRKSNSSVGVYLHLTDKCQ